MTYTTILLSLLLCCAPCSCRALSSAATATPIPTIIPDNDFSREEAARIADLRCRREVKDPTFIYGTAGYDGRWRWVGYGNPTGEFPLAYGATFKEAIKLLPDSTPIVKK